MFAKGKHCTACPQKRCTKCPGPDDHQCEACEKGWTLTDAQREEPGPNHANDPKDVKIVHYKECRIDICPEGKFRHWSPEDPYGHWDKNAGYYDCMDQCGLGYWADNEKRVCNKCDESRFCKSCTAAGSCATCSTNQDD